VPSDRGNLAFDWSNDLWGGLLRFNYYGSWSTTGGCSARDASDASGYGSEVLVDLEAHVDFGEHFVAAGGDNISQLPDREQDGTFQYLGVVHSVTSPFGFNGALWYLRASFYY
jgi:iron complex outermembrane receptor protein